MCTLLPKVHVPSKIYTLFFTSWYEYWYLCTHWYRLCCRPSDWTLSEHLDLHSGGSCSLSIYQIVHLVFQHPFVFPHDSLLSSLDLSNASAEDQSALMILFRCHSCSDLLDIFATTSAALQTRASNAALSGRPVLRGTSSRHHDAQRTECHSANHTAQQ